MDAPWEEYKFTPEERERMNEIEDWAIENEDEIAPRIVYLERLIKNLTDAFNNQAQQGQVKE